MSERADVKRELPRQYAPFGGSPPVGWPTVYVAASDYDTLKQQYDELRADVLDAVDELAYTEDVCAANAITMLNDALSRQRNR